MVPSLALVAALALVADDPTTPTTPTTAPTTPTTPTTKPPVAIIGRSGPPDQHGDGLAAEKPSFRRVFVAPIGGDDRGTARLVGDRVLVAAKELGAQLDVIGAADVQDILDAEAAKQAMGCDSTSCSNEIADALNAEELVSGELGRIGDTWQLTLTRTERRTLRVLGRASRESRGDTPEGLLDDIPAQVREVFGAAPRGPSLLPIAGTGAVVVGGVGVVVGVALYTVSWMQFFAAKSALDVGTQAKEREARGNKELGEAVLPWAYVAAGAGAAVAAAGAVLVAMEPSP